MVSESQNGTTLLRAQVQNLGEKFATEMESCWKDIGLPSDEMDGRSAQILDYTGQFFDQIVSREFSKKYELQEELNSAIDEIAILAEEVDHEPWRPQGLSIRASLAAVAERKQLLLGLRSQQHELEGALRDRANMLRGLLRSNYASDVPEDGVALQNHVSELEKLYARRVVASTESMKWLAGLRIKLEGDLSFQVDDELANSFGELMPHGDVVSLSALRENYEFVEAHAKFWKTARCVNENISEEDIVSDQFGQYLTNLIAKYNIEVQSRWNCLVQATRLVVESGPGELALHSASPELPMLTEVLNPKTAPEPVPMYLVEQYETQCRALVAQVSKPQFSEQDIGVIQAQIPELWGQMRLPSLERRAYTNLMLKPSSEVTQDEALQLQQVLAALAERIDDVKPILRNLARFEMVLESKREYIKIRASRAKELASRKEKLEHMVNVDLPNVERKLRKGVAKFESKYGVPLAMRADLAGGETIDYLISVVVDLAANQLELPSPEIAAAASKNMLVQHEPNFFKALLRRGAEVFKMSPMLSPVKPRDSKSAVSMLSEAFSEPSQEVEAGADPRPEHKVRAQSEARIHSLHDIDSDGITKTRISEKNIIAEPSNGSTKIEFFDCSKDVKKTSKKRETSSPPTLSRPSVVPTEKKLVKREGSDKAPRKEKSNSINKEGASGGVETITKENSSWSASFEMPVSARLRGIERHRQEMAQIQIQMDGEHDDNSPERVHAQNSASKSKTKLWQSLSEAPSRPDFDTVSNVPRRNRSDTHAKSLSPTRQGSSNVADPSSRPEWNPSYGDGIIPDPASPPVTSKFRTASKSRARSKSHERVIMSPRRDSFTSTNTTTSIPGNKTPKRSASKKSMTIHTTPAKIHKPKITTTKPLELERVVQKVTRPSPTLETIQNNLNAMCVAPRTDNGVQQQDQEKMLQKEQMRESFESESAAEVVNEPSSSSSTKSRQPFIPPLRMDIVHGKASHGDKPKKSSRAERKEMVAKSNETVSNNIAIALSKINRGPVGGDRLVGL